MTFLKDPRTRLVLTSATLLFVELLLIRWIPATVKYVGFFSNFLLMASFLGIGLGILLGRTARPRPVFAPLLAIVVALVLTQELNVQIHSQDELFFGLTESSAANINFLVLPLIFILATALMAALALPLGPLLTSRPPLEAYALDIAGSLAGIAGFTALAAAGTPPVVWFAVVTALLLLLRLGLGVTRWSGLEAAAMGVVLWLSLAQSTSGDIWSPYYRITTYTDDTGLLNINVDGIPHQSLHAANGPQEAFYQQVYRWFPARHFGQVLIVGAGSGTDTAIALAHGADHIDAVEIDPAIQQIGVASHPDHPYQDPRVTRITNDGRAYLRGTDKRYDLVLFALPDSLTLVSSTASLRLESFLFTDGSFASVRDHLTSDGVFVLYNYYREPWLVTKIDAMLERAFGTPPLLRTYSNVQAAFADGPGVAALTGRAPADPISAVPQEADPQPTPATDDWPFLYLRTPAVAPYYLAALGFVLLTALIGLGLTVSRAGRSVRSFSPHFFVLGAAFLLLETRSLVTFSLLFGTTWLVNALVFFAILASVLVAIAISARTRLARPGLLYAALFATLGIAILVSPDTLFVEPAWLRYLIVSVVTFSPVFLANLVFTYSFRETAIADMAFASNLLGATLGGILEYAALLIGYRALVVAIALLYALAWLFAVRWPHLADVRLVSRGELHSDG